MQEKGLQVRSPLGNFTVNPVQATDNPAEVGPVDVVLFMVKLYDTEAAARQIKPLIGTNTAVISFQNGVDACDMLSAVLGKQHVMGGVVLCPASVPEPGVISHNGKMAKLLFGEFDAVSSERAEALRAAMEREKSTPYQGPCCLKQNRSLGKLYPNSTHSTGLQQEQAVKKQSTLKSKS